jgi:hypothetical protein
MIYKKELSNSETDVKSRDIGRLMPVSTESTAYGTEIEVA